MPILDYIKHTWSLLTRSNRNLAAAAADPKADPRYSGRWLVYVASGEDMPAIETELRRQMQPGTYDAIEIRRLSSNPAQIREEGLLYLPRPYVVPGGEGPSPRSAQTTSIQVAVA